jgi:NTE family protein
LLILLKKLRQEAAVPYPFRNLIFEGGGVKGVAYVGALEVLDGAGILPQIERVGGASIGAVNAVLVALGYRSQEMLDILLPLDFQIFLDDSWGVVRDARRFLREYGWYRGETFRAWMGDLIAARTGNPRATFQDLRTLGFPALYLVGTNLSTGFFEVFSPEHTPRMRVVDAARISMSLPLVFTAVRDMRSDVFVDGGVLNNYPIRLFDRERYVADPAHRRVTGVHAAANAAAGPARPPGAPYVYNAETLGFRLDERRREIDVFRDGAEPVVNEIDDLFDYTHALVRTLLYAQEAVHLESEDWQRTVYIDTLGIGPFDFDIDRARKLALVASGREHARAWLEWYDAPDSRPFNRV